MLSSIRFNTPAAYRTAGRHPVAEMPHRFGKKWALTQEERAACRSRDRKREWTDSAGVSDRLVFASARKRPDGVSSRDRLLDISA
jgi:hypothetical protein